MLLVLFPLLGPAFTLALSIRPQRDLVGLLGDDNQPTGTVHTGVLPELPSASVSITSDTPHIIGPSATALVSTSDSGITSTTFLSSVITTASTAITNGLNLSVPTPSPYGLPEIPPTSPEEATQWKAIGMGIITVGLIAVVLLSIIFFDSWWGFVCDLCGCGKSRKHDEENMVPDWETRSWEYKLANEDGHRYPTMSSLGDIIKEQSKLKESGVLPPSPVYLPDYDPPPRSFGPQTEYASTFYDLNV